MNIVDITDAVQKKLAYAELRMEQARQASTKSRIVFGIACGDGTILTLLDEAHSVEKIDLDALQVCALPFGTGNDFSQVFGWGNQPQAIWT